MADELESAELHTYRERARAWLAANIPPRARLDDGSYEEPDLMAESDPAYIAVARERQAAVFDAGFAGIPFPVEYGGQGLSYDHERVFLEEQAAYDTRSQVFMVSINILGATVVEFGTEEQKKRHVPKILRGEEIWLQFLSEPSGGSDLAGMLTRATRDGDTYVINGQKTWSTGAQRSDFAICPTRTRWDVPKHKGISVFILDLRSPGVDLRPIKQINGGAEFCEEFLTDVVVPASNMLGDENEGWRVARGLLNIEHAWQGRNSGVAEAAGVDDLIALATERGLIGDVGVQRKIVDLHVASHVQSLAAQRITNGMTSGALHHGYGPIVKVGGALNRQRRAELGKSLAGSVAAGWRPGDEDRWSRDLLSSRSATLAGGSNEVLRNNVSEQVLGLPREASPDRELPFNQVPHN